MKKLMTLTALALASTGFAQTWEANNGKLTLVGCYGKQDGVYCDYSFVLTKKQTATVRWSNDDFKIFKQDGTSQVAVPIGTGEGVGWTGSLELIHANYCVWIA